MNLTKTNWPRGYTPSADAVNGSPDGLIRMYNLYLDELGVLSLVRGIQKLSVATLADYPYRIYSKILQSNNEAIWATLGLNSAQIIRTAKGDFSDTITIGSGNGKGSFGDCLGEVIVFAGNTRLKDNSKVVQNLGLLTALTPIIKNISHPQLNLSGVYIRHNKDAMRAKLVKITDILKAWNKANASIRSAAALASADTILSGAVASKKVFPQRDSLS